MPDDERQPLAERAVAKHGYPQGKSAGLKFYFDPKSLAPRTDPVHEDDIK